MYSPMCGYRNGHEPQVPPGTFPQSIYGTVVLSTLFSGALCRWDSHDRADTQIIEAGVNTQKRTSRVRVTCHFVLILIVILPE